MMKSMTCSVNKPTTMTKFDTTLLYITTQLLEFLFVEHRIPSTTQHALSK